MTRFTSHMSRGAHARHNAARICRSADRSRSAVKHRTVARRSTGKVVTLYQAGKASSLAGSDNIHFVLGLEHLVDQDLIPYFQRRFALYRLKLPQNAARRDSGFFEVPGSGFVHPRRTNELHETQLDRFIAVRILRLLLNHDAGAGLDDGDRNYDPVLIEDLSHPYLYSNQSINHICTRWLPNS